LVGTVSKIVFVVEVSGHCIWNDVRRVVSGNAVDGFPNVLRRKEKRRAYFSSFEE
jgi:hypothetical protein